MNKELIRTSKFLSLVLRHRPGVIGIELDPNGWTDVGELLNLAAKQGRSISMDLLRCVVRDNDKQRFVFNTDETRIRANQGHSVSIDPGLEARDPPACLYHGTATRFLASIRGAGLLRGNRQHVHLSPDVVTATQIGQRHGKPIVLGIDAGRLHAQGHVFYLSDNGVWLTDDVPAAYITFP